MSNFLKMDLSFRKKLDESIPRFNAKLINSLTGPKSTTLIGTFDEDDPSQTNCAIFSSVVHLGADPALIGFIVRPDSVDRHTLTNIRKSGLYTMNTVSYSFIKKAHQTSARYPENRSEFKEVGLREEYLDGFRAPFVKEALLKWSMRWVRSIPIEENGTHFIIGRVENIYLDSSILGEDGHIWLDKIDPAVVIGLDEYCKASDPIRFSYAKPDQDLKEVSFKKWEL